LPLLISDTVAPLNIWNIYAIHSVHAAEALYALEHCIIAFPVLEAFVIRPWAALQAARSVVEIGEKTKPIVHAMLKAQKSYLSGPGGQRKYRYFVFSSFFGWALSTAVEHCGEQPL
jgi:hypothetical protein